MDDGFGQGLFADLKFWWRFRRCRRWPVDWSAPDDVQRRHWDNHPLCSRFGDATLAVAEVDGRMWLIRERDWHGWPDPPRFVFFALAPDGTIWCACDFGMWPEGWRRPGLG